MDNLLLLASPLIMAETYKDLAVLLSKDFKVHLIDLPASGRATSRKVWNEKTYARWLLDWLNDKQLAEAYILGHSNSGSVAIQFAADYPEKVKGLILADTIGVNRKSLVVTTLARGLDALIEFKFSIRAFKYLWWNIKHYPKNLFKQVLLSAKTDLSNTLTKITAPTLIAWGKKDHTMPLNLAYVLKQKIHSASFVLSQKGSHDWAIIFSEDFAEKVSLWKKKINLKM